VIGGIGCGLIFCTTSCAAGVTVTNSCTGPSTDASDVNTCYTFTVSTQGSKDGIVNAFYLSGEDDLPGIILLEGQNLSDPEFYIGVQDDVVDITGQFNPALNNAVAIASMACAPCTRITVTTCSAHGFVVNDFVYIYNTTNGVFGKKTVLAVTCSCPTFTFDIAGTVCCVSSTGRVFETEQVSDNSSSPNRIYFSKCSQPEAVPLVNFLDVGGKDDEIQRIIALRDNLFIIKDNGVYILNGDTPSSFSQRLLDNSVSILAPDSAAVLNNQIYMLSTQGIATVSDTGIGVISHKIEDKILETTNSNFCVKKTSVGIGYESDRSYIIWLPTVSTDTVATQAYRYNTFNESWVRWDVGARAAIVNPVDDKLYIASDTTAFIKQERKNDDRTDYADLQFCLCFAAQTIDPCVTSFEISSVSCVVAGDVLVQTQCVTVSTFNRLLRKLDFDVGLDCNDYNCDAIIIGACLSAAMCALVVKINADDCTVCYTSPTGGSFAQDKIDFNLLACELNTSAKPSFSNYAEVTDTTEFEIIITGVCSTFNTVCVGYLMPFIKGPVEHYKGITSVIGWAPQHFGDPSVTKQVSEGTIVFDGNNFFSACVAYATDLSKDFSTKEFFGRGNGFWGGFCYECYTWGGDGTDAPLRTLIPREKQRCRYIFVRFKHVNAREDFTILGISLKPRKISERGYRDI
jgi:hypothetical protein